MHKLYDAVQLQLWLDQLLMSC